MTEWVPRSAFAEVAEAVGVATDQMISGQPALIVIYATSNDEDADVMMAVLVRRATDQILECMHVRRISSLHEFTQDCERSLDDVLGGDDA